MEQLNSKSKPGEQLLSNTSKKHHSRSYPLVVKYNPHLPNMNSIIRRNLYILDIDPLTKSLFKDKIFVTFKMESNIKALLTSSRFKEEESTNTTEDTTNTEGNGGSISCGKCSLCKNFLLESKIATSYYTSQTYPIKGTVTCDTKYMIYHINDISCCIDYVGYRRDRA